MNRILIIEPQCWGLEHANFNAALLSAVLCAYPDAGIDFLAEREHLQGVREALTAFGPDTASRVAWREIRIVRRELTGWLRFLTEYRQTGTVLRDANTQRVGLVLFASIANTGVLALKLRAVRWPRSVPILAVMHGMMNRVVGRWPIKPWNWPLNLRVVLRLPQPPAVWYLLLGTSLHRAFVTMQPRLARNFASIELPTLSFAADCDACLPSARPAILRFGHLGVGNISKGFGPFARLASELGRSTGGVEFVLAGHLGSHRDNTDHSAVVGVTESPLAIDEYKRRASSLTYVVSMANPDDYRVAASSSFVEALFHGKPGIYRRNEYVAHVFAAMGDIGYLCDSDEEVLETVRGLITSFPVERYRRQVANICEGRRMFEPEAVGEGLRRVVDAARSANPCR